MAISVWVVDDEKSIRWILEKALDKAGYQVRSFERASDCLTECQQLEAHNRPSALLIDIRMPDMSGLELMVQLRQYDIDAPIIIMTAFTDIGTTVSAFQDGAWEYVAKPFDITQVLQLIAKATQQHASVIETNGEVVGLIGRSPIMLDVFRMIGRLSQSLATVLINGESGVGKELVARALHDYGPRRDKPFVAINTAAIPRELLESELFGHERGAFTGASSRRDGRFGEAADGTLFLDEIGDMPVDMQTRLLRVLSDGHYYSVGGNTPRIGTARIIAATNKKLSDLVKEGTFREDLYYRLNVINIHVPALKERAEDIPLLIQHFLQRSSQILARPIKQIDQNALNVLQKYPYPGNVRELENLCHWLTVMTSSLTIGADDLPREVLHFCAEEDDATPVHVGWENSLRGQTMHLLEQGNVDIYGQLRERFDQTVMASALEFCCGHKKNAADLLGVGRNTIARKLK